MSRRMLIDIMTLSPRLKVPRTVEEANMTGTLKESIQSNSGLQVRSSKHRRFTASRGTATGGGLLAVNDHDKTPPFGIY